MRAQGGRLKFWGVLILGCLATLWVCLMQPRDGSYDQTDLGVHLIWSMTLVWDVLCLEPPLTPDSRNLFFQ